MTTSVFLSHNSKDKPFVRKLALDLDAQGIRCWLDEAEIKAGESLIEKIRDGIDNVDFLVVILSPNSFNSTWVKKVVDVAMTQEINGRKIKVIPLVLQECELTGLLLGKSYADFIDDSKYVVALEKLVRDLGVVFRKNVFKTSSPEAHIGQAIDTAWRAGLPVLSEPFHRPFQYMGMSVETVAKAVGGIPNSAGNIIIDTEECHMCLEAEGSFVNYVDIELKCTAPSYRNKEFDPEPILGMLSINPAELELVKNATHYHHFSDHRRKLKISVSCLIDGGPLSVGFSSKYYGM